MTQAALSDIQDEAWTAVKDLMGETITYDGDDSLGRSITAVVRFPDDHPDDDVDRFRNALTTIAVDNNSTTGIAASEFTRRDKVTLPPRSGQTAVEKRLLRIVRQNAAFVVYEAN